MSTPSDVVWTPLDAAAKHLGISPDATRKRIERGTLKGEKRHGRWVVDISDLDAASDAILTVGVQPSTGHSDAKWTPEDAGPANLRELVDHLKTENEFLRDQLDKRSRELADERERSDVLHREAFARIEALTAGLVAAEPDLAEDLPANGRRVTEEDPSPASEPPSSDEHLARVHAFVEESKRAPESPQTRDVAPGRTDAEPLSNESNERPRAERRSVFGDWWDWIRGR